MRPFTELVTSAVIVDLTKEEQPAIDALVKALRTCGYSQGKIPPGVTRVLFGHVGKNNYRRKYCRFTKCPKCARRYAAHGSVSMTTQDVLGVLGHAGGA